RDTGQIRKLEGNPYHPGSRGRNCAKGPATLNQIHDPERILYPMRRVGTRKRSTRHVTTRAQVVADEHGRAAVDRAVGQELLFVVECATGAAATILAKQVSFEPGRLQPGSVAPGGDDPRAANAEGSP
ncbi:MAG: hypothetical protein JNK49_14475, partial [Planctomycetes bacterium]|nr:hypothetical protein [Planctomycetota bacterium]